MANILNKKKINFPWKLRVFFYQKTGKNLCIHLVYRCVSVWVKENKMEKKMYIYIYTYIFIC